VAARRSDSVEITSARIPEESARRISQLVAGSVDSPVSFEGSTPGAPGSLQLYRHPADRNAAATGVTVGRRIDVQG
jgi:hypothetical protein